MLYIELSGSRFHRNHRRCWAKDNGWRSPEVSATSAGRSQLCCSVCTCTAKSTRRGCSNRLRRLTDRPRRWRICETICVASNECPPNSKKLFSRSTRLTCNTCRQICASSISSAPCGALPTSASQTCGAGNAARSSLPLRLSGNAASNTSCAGSMYSGRRSPRARRTVSVS
ncbi:hypothetical protein D3C81_1405730 [compost metagenome]